jgi:hypothetical protein
MPTPAVGTGGIRRKLREPAVLPVDRFHGPGWSATDGHVPRNVPELLETDAEEADRGLAPAVHGVFAGEFRVESVCIDRGRSAGTEAVQLAARQSGASAGRT